MCFNCKLEKIGEVDRARVIKLGFGSRKNFIYGMGRTLFDPAQVFQKLRETPLSTKRITIMPRILRTLEPSLFPSQTIQ